jgi:GPH family glycoside/pentoside/hexuronide:cation symporter
MGFKTMVGAWIGKNLEQNERELQSLIELAGKGFADIAAVGNEVLYRGDLPEQAMLDYIRRAKQAIQKVPVSTVDAYFEFINRPVLVDTCDVIPINCYPFWEGSNVEHAPLYLQEMYRKTKDVARGKKIIIAETGWPSQGEPIDDAIPSDDNYIRYFLESQLWATHLKVDCFHFSSHDESWKIHDEGWAGTSWGIWDVNDKLKFISADPAKNS